MKKQVILLIILSLLSLCLTGQAPVEKPKEASPRLETPAAQTPPAETPKVELPKPEAPKLIAPPNLLSPETTLSNAIPKGYYKIEQPIPEGEYRFSLKLPTKTGSLSEDAKATYTETIKIYALKFSDSSAAERQLKYLIETYGKDENVPSQKVMSIEGESITAYVRSSGKNYYGTFFRAGVFLFYITGTNEFNTEQFMRLYLGYMLTPKFELPAQEKLKKIEQETFELINKERVDRGIPPLKWSEDIAAAARTHSGDMARYDFFSHTNKLGLNLLNRLDIAGVQYGVIKVGRYGAGENIAMSSDGSPSSALNAWAGSAEYQENLFDVAWKETGIGVAQSSKGYYFTQIFIFR